MSFSRRVAAAAAVLALLAAAPALAPAAGAAPRTRSAVTFAGVPSVGAVFISGLLPLHICTASVIRSANRSVIMTAAHCIRGGPATGYEFAPGYHDGKAPYGYWRVAAAYAAPGWVHRTDVHEDWAFLVVAPKRVDGRLRRLQQVTGGNRLGATPRSGLDVTAVGYPLGIGGSPIHCRTRVFRHGRFSGFHCAGFADGTSGGPWLAGHRSKRRVVGVIGGLHQGGCTGSTSYSSPLGRPARQTLWRAGHDKRADVFPNPPNDGC